MISHKIMVLSLGAILSGSSLYAIEAGSTKPPSDTVEPVQKQPNANLDTGSLPNGADGSTTDIGPTPLGSKTGGGSQKGGGDSSARQVTNLF